MLAALERRTVTRDPGAADRHLQILVEPLVHAFECAFADADRAVQAGGELRDVGQRLLRLRFADRTTQAFDLATRGADRSVARMQELAVGLLGFAELRAGLGKIRLHLLELERRFGRTVALAVREACADLIGQLADPRLETRRLLAQALTDARVSREAMVVARDLQPQLLSLVVEHGLRVGGFDLGDRMAADRGDQSSESGGEHLRPPPRTRAARARPSPRRSSSRSSRPRAGRGPSSRA